MLIRQDPHYFSLWNLHWNWWWNVNSLYLWSGHRSEWAYLFWKQERFSLSFFEVINNNWNALIISINETWCIPVFVGTHTMPFSLETTMNGPNCLLWRSWPLLWQSRVSLLTVRDWHHIFLHAELQTQRECFESCEWHDAHISQVPPRSTTPRPNLYCLFANGRNVRSQWSMIVIRLRYFHWRWMHSPS